MSDWSDALAYLDLIDPIEGVLSTFRYADWQGAYARAGIVGVIGELAACFAAANCWTVWVYRDGGWSGIEIERLLFRHGVRVWGRGFSGDRLFFRVKRRQARWAEYLLLRRGIPVAGIAFDSRNQDYARDYAPGSEPPVRQANRRAPFDWIDWLRDLFRL